MQGREYQVGKDGADRGRRFAVGFEGWTNILVSLEGLSLKGPVIDDVQYMIRVRWLVLLN